MKTIPKKFHAIPKQEFVLHTSKTKIVTENMEVKPIVIDTQISFIGRVDYDETQITANGHVVQFGKLFFNKNALDVEIKTMDYITSTGFKARITQQPVHWTHQRTGKYLGSTTQIQIFVQEE